MSSRILRAFIVLFLTTSLAAAAVDHDALPVAWRIRLDPDDVGVKQQWFSADHDDAQWTSLGTHDWEGWRKQGLEGDSDVAWYRVEHAVPDAILAKKHVYLYFTCVDEQAWVWINGKSAGEHTLESEGLDEKSEARPRFWVTPFALDVRNLLRAGANQVAVRVLAGGNAGGGIWKPVYLFASDEPIELKEMNDHAEGLNLEALNAKESVTRYEVWTSEPYDPVWPHSTGSGDVQIEVQGTAGSQARARVDAIRVSAACGEYVPVVLHVRNLAATTLPIRFDFADVRHESLGWGPKKTNMLLMRADRVQVHVVDYVLTRLKKLVPDPLPRAGGANGMNLGPGETGSYFVLIDTRGMPSGLWKGRAKLTPRRSGPTLEIPFELKVAPVVLPQRVPIWVTFWTYPPASGWMGEGRGPNERYVELMERTGSNVVQMSYRDGGPPPILDENHEIIGIKFDEFDRMMQRRRFTHHDYLVCGLTISKRTGTGRWGPHFLEEGHERWQRNFVTYMRMLARHIRDNYGIPHDRWGLYMNDEHIGEQFLPLGKLVREADPDIQIWANRIEDLETLKKAEPYIDVIVPYSPWLSPKGLGHGRSAEAEMFFLKTGKSWWAYRHNFWRTPERTAYPRADPDSSHGMLRSRPWLAWKLGLDGYGYWVFTAPRWWGRYDGFPDVAPKGPFTNTGFIYMGHDGPVTSRRLEAYRDGWEDYKLLWIVKQAAALEVQDADLARQALAHLDGCVEKVLAGADAGALRGMRRTLMDHAARLNAADPVTAMIRGVDRTSHSATVRLSASHPVRVWGWLNRGDNHRRFIDTSRATHTPVVAIDGLVPAERCDLTLVVGGPGGQQVVLQHDFVTEGW